jgi:translation initiation factor 1
MSAKKTKIDLDAPRTALTDSPFGALGSLRGELPREPVAPPKPKAEIIVDTPKVAWRVAKTRKGGWPLTYEKRPGGKLATVIQNISGDGTALVTALKKHCAAGGAFKDGVIELQGDHRVKVAAFLDKHQS